MNHKIHSILMYSPKYDPWKRRSTSISIVVTMFSCFLRCITAEAWDDASRLHTSHTKSLWAQVRQQDFRRKYQEKCRKIPSCLAWALKLAYQKPAAIVQHLLEHVTSCLRRERFNDLSIPESGRNIGSYNLESLKWYIDAKELQKQNF